MNATCPPTLAYFLIYNPTNPVELNTAKDSDEDAREESHILFYTSQDQVTSKDRMLRQTGLAKAIVNFSELFTSSRNLDNVHTQSKRMVSISPEPNFWIHICVNLAKTLKVNRKPKEGNATASTTYYYYQESVPDLLLRSCLFQGYEQFKLFHGSFSSNLSSGQLQRQLERFFTPWAWQLDFDSFNTTYHRSDPHVHPSNSSLRPIASDFAKILPPNSLPILLTSSQLVTFSDEYEYPSSLLKYLWSVSRSADPEAQQKAQEPTPEISRTSYNSNDKSNAGSRFSSPSFGSVMNLKKWSWPGSLTFKGTAVSDNSQHAPSAFSAVAMPDLIPIEGSKNEANTTRGASSYAVTSPSQLVQSALNDNDAIAATNCHLPPAKENAYIALISEDSDAPNTLLSISGSRAGFTSRPIFLSYPHGPDSQPRQLLYIFALHSVFALVVDVSWSQEKNHVLLERLLFNTMRFLKIVREALKDNNSMDKPKKSDYILRFEPNLTYANGVVPKEDVSYLNENSKLMQDDNIQEIFSRPQSPKAWFVSKRCPNLSVSNRICVEANFAVNIKEASLIGANNEVESVMRRFDKP